MAALQVLDKLDLNDGTVQHVVLASIPPQEVVPAEVRGSRQCLHVPFCLSTYLAVVDYHWCTCVQCPTSGFKQCCIKLFLYHAEHHVVLHEALEVP